MKINEVEALVGITKKNIRFYEEQGLLSPRRNAENGYRDYGEEELKTLQRIKLLRKMGLPIEDIRRMLEGSLTVGDGMRRHLVTLERQRVNLEHSITLCRSLQDVNASASALDTEELLARMDALEKGGASFSGSINRDVRVRYVAPIVVTTIMLALMICLGAIFVWALKVDPAGAPPLWIIIIFEGLLAAVGFGVILALSQRIREIRKGEIDDAKNY